MNHELERLIGEHLDAADYDTAISIAAREYGPEIKGYLESGVDEALAEDAYSAFEEAIVKGIRGFRRTCSFRTWAYVVAQNALRQAYRRQLKFVRLDTSRGEKLPQPTNSTQSPFANTTNIGLVQRLRSQLNEEEQKLLVLRVDRKLQYSEISLILSTPDAPITAGALRSRYHELKRKLRANFEKAAERS
jgi:RNA polymerase sigma-70 factor (ECF subfamily)